MSFEKRIAQRPVLAIWRGITAADVGPLIDLCLDLQLLCVEITLNTPNACHLIDAAVRHAAGGLAVGAGTVLSREGALDALDAGAEFLVSPALVDDVQNVARENGIPTLPGALTPTEVLRAREAGAAQVKLFPASLHGPSYIRELKGPFDDLPILACGGVRPENVGDYFAAGASAVAIGGKAFELALLRSGRWDVIRERVSAVLDAVPSP